MKRDLLLSFFLITLIVLTRTVIHAGPNIEFITGAGVCSGYFFINKKFALMIPIISLLLTDAIIGNSIIFLFTWTAFLTGPIIGMLMHHFSKEKNLKTKLAVSQLSGITSTLIFFLWTNLGVVLTTTMYSKDMNGLMQSYINALPFLRNQIAGNLVIVPLLFTAGYAIYNLKNFTLPNSKKFLVNNQKAGMTTLPARA